MNKILTAVVVGMVSVAAFGELSWATVNTAAYGGDTSPSQAGTSAYSGYLCTIEAAQQQFEATTIKGVTDYFKNNFAAGSTTLGELSAAGTTEAKLTGGATALDAVEWGEEQYSFTTYFAQGSLAASEYLGILLYSSGDDQAVRVFSATSNGTTWLADDDIAMAAGSAGSWTKAVPEPTSGLLLLLGLAGLALKRKNALL